MTTGWIPLLLMLLVACGSADPPQEGGGTEPHRPTEDLLYTCGYGEFDPSRLEGPGDLEHSESPLGEALRELLKTPDGTIGGEGWRIVLENGNETVVAAPTENKELPYVSALFQRSGEGWKPQGWGDCLPMAVVGGRSPATWTLESAPEPDATELDLLVEERACSSGRRLTEDNTRADIEYSEDEITIVMSADSLSAGKNEAYTCIGVPPSPITITLEEPVNGRELLDAGSYPPRRRDD